MVFRLLLAEVDFSQYEEDETIRTPPRPPLGAPAQVLLSDRSKKIVAKKWMRETMGWMRKRKAGTSDSGSGRGKRGMRRERKVAGTEGDHPHLGIHLHLSPCLSPAGMCLYPGTDPPQWDHRGSWTSSPPCCSRVPCTLPATPSCSHSLWRPVSPPPLIRERIQIGSPRTWEVSVKLPEGSHQW